ncbi:MAG: hypothetical protein C0617_01935 [Desulfuromonas sp.]|uniref:hypothetical protein n=1 Tax=Desulfuromonas sp. TaxID=892 RepID=UPI000CA7D6FE|nr:hypothetical protein [Desulfuromonas sp.]PLX86143.1 MAG: hypothetical protein C0617_01935 [Desulfuromonas sp.]
MKKQFSMILAALMVLSFPLVASAMDHKGHEGHDHGKMEATEPMGHEGHDHGEMEHDSMAMKGDMIPVGTDTVDGVAAKGMLKDISAAMARMGMAMTHHFMVFLTDDASGDALAEGLVAIKVTGPDGTTTGPTKLMGMGAGFGADLALKEAGEYNIVVGTKMADGKKRQFSFSYQKAQ